MEPLELVKKYLPKGRVMQLATVSGGKPWICTVYFVVDEDLNLYWLSFPARRHSSELEQDPRVAIAVAVKLDKPVIGVQLEGSATRVTDKATVRAVMERYVQKYNTGQQFYDQFVAGANEHVMYKCAPHNIVLFDEVDFTPSEGRKEISLR